MASTDSFVGMMNRWDETWHRLREWTNGQGPSERLAAQILIAEGYEDVDPTHPLGGPDGGKDARVMRHGDPWIMAVYFPRGQRSFRELEKKLLADHQGVAANDACGMAFVTNQEITDAERMALERSVGTPVQILHLERITAVLDQPRMAGVREQFLGISSVPPAATAEERTLRDILDASPPTPGARDHWMIYDGMLLLRVVAMPAPAGLRHPAARDPRSALAAASELAGETSAAWPKQAYLLARRLSDGWDPIAAHQWGAGRTFQGP
jgi:hypothetical protein